MLPKNTMFLGYQKKFIECEKVKATTYLKYFLHSKNSLILLF